MFAAYLHSFCKVGLYYNKHYVEREREREICNSDTVECGICAVFDNCRLKMLFCNYMYYVGN